MKQKIHVRMGRLIYKKMAENGMPMKKHMFLLGSLAPDLFFSYLYRPHNRASSGANLERHLRHLFDGGLRPDGPSFSFHLGVIVHYVCDFFCYAHTPVFSGGLSEHVAHESSQSVSRDGARYFDKHKSSNIALPELIASLDRFFSRHEQRLSHDAAASAYDIPIAIHVACWSVSAAYQYAMAAEMFGDDALPVES